MKKAFFIFLLCLLAVSLSSCKKTDQPKEQQQAAQEQNQEEEESFFGSMKDLLTRDKSLKCTYEEKNSDGDDNSSSRGEMYIAGGKARTDIVNISENGEEDMHMIMDSDWMYTWTSFMPKGTKMKLDTLQESENFEKKGNINQGFQDLAKELNYKCRPWIVDGSKFIPPSDIVFDDITEMMAGFAEEFQNMDAEEMQEGLDEATEAVCDLCEYAPDEETKANCKADAGCE
ncbi:MAG: hypothetical protein ABIG60_01810 [Patescibacteria group bacterium]